MAKSNERKSKLLKPWKAMAAAARGDNVEFAMRIPGRKPEWYAVSSSHHFIADETRIYRIKPAKKVPAKLRVKLTPSSDPDTTLEREGNSITVDAVMVRANRTDVIRMGKIAALSLLDTELKELLAVCAIERLGKASRQRHGISLRVDRKAMRATIEFSVTLEETPRKG